MNNTYYGVWDPTAGGQLPDISGLDFAAYYILNSAVINGVSYKKDNWLVYFCHARGTKGEKQVWRTTASLILSNPDSHTNVPDPGYYTKVRLDNAGNIVEGDTLDYDDLPKELKDKVNQFSDDVLEEKVCIVVSNIFQNSVLSPIQFKWDKNTKKLSADIKIDEETIKLNSFGELFSEGGSGDGGSSSENDPAGQCAIHEHLSSQIADFEQAVVNIINSYSLLNSIKNSLNNLIDGETIVLNKNGQLASIATAVAPHYHVMDDITDLNQDIANVWASDQYLNKEQGDIFNEGIIDMNGLRIKEILVAFNKLIEENRSNIEELKSLGIGGGSLSKLEPTEPNDIDTADFTFLSKPVDVIDTKTNSKVQAYKSLSIETKDIIYNHGTIISAYIDNEKVNELECFVRNEKSDFYLNVKANGFTPTYIGDAYPKIKTFQGFYEGFTFKYEKDNLDEGEHTIYFTTKVVGTIAEVKSKEYKFFIYKEKEQDIYFTVKDNISYEKISGIKVIQYDPIFDVDIRVSSYYNRFAPVSKLRIKTEEEKEGVELIPYKYEDGYSYYNTRSYIVKEDGYFIFDLVCESIENKKYTTSYRSDYLNIDYSKLEYKYRVMITEGSYNHQLDQLTYFDKYDSNKSLVSDSVLDGDSYYYQAQIMDNIAITDYPNLKKYNLGDDYSIKPKRGYLYLKFDSVHLHNFYFDLLDKDGNAFEKNKDGSSKGIEIFAGFTSLNSVLYWVNCNKPFDGFSRYKETYDFNGLDLFRSTDKRKYVTLGRDAYSTDSNLYIKINLNNTNLDVKAFIESIEESINERR